MNTKTIRQSVAFKASPHGVYEALMDSDKHSQFTGDKADISREVGGRFTAFDRYSEGVNIELVQDKRSFNFGVLVIGWKVIIPR